jgi:hypothetical protein
VLGNRAYIAWGSYNSVSSYGGVSVIDISVSAAQLLGSYPHLPYEWLTVGAVQIVGSRAYVAAGPTRVLEIGDPTAIHELRSD